MTRKRKGTPAAKDVIEHEKRSKKDEAPEGTPAAKDVIEHEKRSKKDEAPEGTPAAKDVIEPKKRSKKDEAPQYNYINEAQLQFDKLYAEEYIKLNPDYQTHIHGIDTTLTEEMFNQIQKCTAMEHMRYVVVKHMMMHAIDSLQTASIVSGQTTGQLKRYIEKLEEEKELNKKKINDMDAEIQQLRMKNTEASAKMNILPDVPIDEKIESQEAETEAISGKNQVQDPIDVQMDSQCVEAANIKDTMATPEAKDIKNGQEENAEEKKRTRTLVRNVRTKDDRKANVLPEFDYVPVQKIQKKKAKYIYAVSDSESPSIMPQPEQTLEPIIDREKVLLEKMKPIVEKAKPIPKVVKPKPIPKGKPAKKTNAKSSKTDKDSYLPSATQAYRLLDENTREKIKEYYRKDDL